VEGDDEVPDSLEFTDSLLEDSTMNDSTAVVPTSVQLVGTESDMTQDGGALDATQGSALVATHDAQDEPIVASDEVVVFSPVGNDVTPEVQDASAHVESVSWEFSHMNIDQDDSGDEGSEKAGDHVLMKAFVDLDDDMATPVPKFDGTPTESLGGWARKMKAHFKLKKIEDEEEKIATAVLCLGGEADSIINRLGEEIPKSFDALLKALEVGLRPARVVQAQDILNLCQGARETIPEFSKRVRSTLSGADIVDEFHQCLWFRGGAPRGI